MASSSHTLSRRAFGTILLGGCAAAIAPGGLIRSVAAAPKTFSDGFSRSRPEKQGVSPEAILAFLDDVQGAGLELHSFMLYRHGHVIAEGWWSPYRAELPHMMHSLTKSVTACGVGLAIAEGRFKLSDKVVSFFPDELPPKVDDKLAAMTVEDLLTMRTGHEKMTSGSVWRPIKTSWVAEFFKIPVFYQPGTTWVYTSAASYMLSAIITKTTGQTLVEYLTPRFFEPLNIRGFQWDVGPNNISPGANGLSWKTSDSLKLGVLHLHKGLWNGKRVLPEDWVAAVQAQHVPGKYGYQWWLGPGGISYANGMFSQYSFVFPEQDAVLAMTSAVKIGTPFPQRIFTHFPKAFGEAPASAEGGKALTKRLASLRLLPVQKPTDSPTVRRISGKTFTAEQNEDNVQSVRFDFTRDRCRFTLCDARGEHVIVAGLRNPVEGQTTMTGNKLHHEYQPPSMRVVAGGQWSDENTFVMTWTFVESAFRDTVICRFDGSSMTMDRSVNVNSKALALATLKARMA